MPEGKEPPQHLEITLVASSIELQSGGKRERVCESHAHTHTHTHTHTQSERERERVGEKEEKSTHRDREWVRETDRQREREQEVLSPAEVTNSFRAQKGGEENG